MATEVSLNRRNDDHQIEMDKRTFHVTWKRYRVRTVPIADIFHANLAIFSSFIIFLIRSVASPFLVHRLHSLKELTRVALTISGQSCP